MNVASQDRPFDLITTGRIGVDLYPLETRKTLGQVQQFTKSLGGSPTNVAAGAARLGCRVAVITKVGDDPFGVFLRDDLEEYGVDIRWVGTDADLRTPVVFCEIHPPDEFPLLFYREPAAPDMQLRVDDMDLLAISAATIFWTTGTGLSAEPSREAVISALRERAANLAPGQDSIHDLDYRPGFWPSADLARRWSREAIRHATIAVGNLDEVEMATGHRDPEAAAKDLLALGVRLAVVKKGSEGVFALNSDGEGLELEPIRLDVLNGLGAGDAFGAALCAGLIARDGTERSLRAANAAGALVASRLACAPDMPTVGELESLLAGGAHA